MRIVKTGLCSISFPSNQKDQNKKTGAQHQYGRRQRYEIDGIDPQFRGHTRIGAGGTVDPKAHFNRTDLTGIDQNIR
jgi:hypothetical protein